MDTNIAGTKVGSQTSRDSTVRALYDRLEDRCLMRDQQGASDVYYDLIRAGRPLTEIIAEGVRIHAPYTHVPYHERIDDGYPNFVNNDHCLLSARATLNLNRMLPEHLAMLPMAQTIWYIPTGLDIWNQKINKAPGHYSRHRGNMGHVEAPPAPVVYWPDQEPEVQTGPLKERLNNWMTLVHRGQVIEAYRLFLGLMQNPAERREVLAEMCFAGLADVQDRLLHNRSYTTGHKAYRARSTVELGNALGWDSAHNVIYAGALDIAVGPRWYSTYEVACNYIKMMIEGEALHAVPYGGVSEAELAVLRNKGEVNQAEAAELTTAILRQGEIETLEAVTRLLKAGKDPRRILDVTAIGGGADRSSKPAIRTAFNMPHHCYEYQNTLGWFYDTFDHPRPPAAALCRGDVRQSRGLSISRVSARCIRRRRRCRRAPARLARVSCWIVWTRRSARSTARKRSAGRRPIATTCSDRAPAGAAYRAGRLQAGERSAQSGDRPVHPDGSCHQPAAGSRQAAAGGGVSHRDAPQIRRSAGAVTSLRSGDGLGGTALTEAMSAAHMLRP